MVEFYKIRKETEDGPKWAINIVFDDPSGTSCSLHPDKYYAILLTKDTAEYALRKLNDPSYSLERDY